MAEGYETEDEQLETLKRWWRENGKFTLISIVVALLAVFGWQGWQKQQQLKLDTASAIYQNLIQISTTDNGVLTAAQRATASHLASTLKADFSGTTYALFAALYKAKFAVEENDLATAEQELQWVLDNNPSLELAMQAHLRLARILYAQQKYDQALAQIANEIAGDNAGFEELRGDIFLAQGNKEGAANAYRKAIQLSSANGGNTQNPVLTMKIQQLESQQQGRPGASAVQQAASEEDA